MDNKILIAVIAVVAVVIVAAAAVVLLKGNDESFDGVIYDGNGGKTEQGETTLKTNELVVKGSSFLRDGYDFVSWNTKADGSGTTYNEGDSVKSGTKLYAQWDNSLKLYVPLASYMMLDHEKVALYIQSGNDESTRTEITAQGTFALPSNAKIVYKGLGVYSTVSVNGNEMIFGNLGDQVTVTLSLSSDIAQPVALSGGDAAACSVTATSGVVQINILSVGN